MADNDNPIPLPGDLENDPQVPAAPPEEEGKFRPETASEAGSKALEEALRMGFVIVRIIIAALIIVFLFSGYHQVESGQSAVVLRFGKALRDGGPNSPITLKDAGGHFAWPAGVDEVVKVPKAEIHMAGSTVGMYGDVTDANAAPGPDGVASLFPPFLDPKGNRGIWVHIVIPVTVVFPQPSVGGAPRGNQ